MINLTKNALKFCKNGVITIRVAYDIELELLNVHIIDTGKGISPGDQTRLFKAFGKLGKAGDNNKNN